MFYFVLAAILLFITYRDLENGESDTIFLLDSWIWFDVFREGAPLIYWACIAAQLFAVVGLVVCGFNTM